MNALFFVALESCTILSSFKSIIPSCEAGYNILNEDQRSFYPGWTSLFNESQGYLSNYSSAINKAFVYSDSDHLDTYTYIGEHATYGDGGYVYEFRGPMAQMISNITRLKELSWLDMHTRAVMIQMSLYNPNVNLFIFVTILVEFIPTGAAYPSARVEPLSLLNYYQGKFDEKTLKESLRRRLISRFCSVQTDLFDCLHALHHLLHATGNPSDVHTSFGLFSRFLVISGNGYYHLFMDWFRCLPMACT